LGSNTNYSRTLLTPRRISVFYHFQFFFLFTCVGFPDSVMKDEEIKLEEIEASQTLTYKNVYYEVRNRELNGRLIYECRCDERLKAKAEGSTLLAYTVGDCVFFKTSPLARIFGTP